MPGHAGAQRSLDVIIEGQVRIREKRLDVASPFASGCFGRHRTQFGHAAQTLNSTCSLLDQLGQLVIAMRDWRRVAADLLVERLAL
jgi:hypothetical protein